MLGMQVDYLVLLSAGVTIYSFSFFKKFNNLKLQLPLSPFPVITYCARKINRGPWVSALLVGRSRDRFPVVSLGIFSVVPSDKTMCPEVD